jgi:hypothetical protein
MNTSPVELLFKLNDLPAPRFIAIHNYRNAKGEISNYLLIAAASYGNAVKKDIERLQRVRYTSFKEDARKQMLESLLRNLKDETRSAASQSQIDSYAKLGQNSRVHVDSRLIRVWGLVRNKSILVPSNYKSGSMGMMDKYKNEIKSELRLSTSNFRQFKLETVTSVTMNGTTLKIVA